MTNQWDVVVVGGGGAGLAAAITAAEMGRTVILVEKADTLGGSTALSIGSITAAGTPDQKAAGVVDTAAEHLADMPAWAGELVDRDNMALCKILTDNAADSIAWLRDSGLEFFGPLEEPPHRKPRMHTVLPNSGAFIYHLSRRANRARVEVRLATRAIRLLREGGRISGVEVLGSGGLIEPLHASRAVILAGGDFTASDEFKARFGAKDHLGIPAVNPFATGDCHRMACEVGAAIINGDLAWGKPRFRFASPPTVPWWMHLPPVRPLTRLMRWSLTHMPRALIRPFVVSFCTTALAPEPRLFADGAALINSAGKTVFDPTLSVGEVIARQPDALAYALLDNRLRQRYSRWPYFVSTAPGVAYAYVQDYESTRPDLCVTNDSLEALATKRGLPADALARSVKECGLGAGPYLLLGPIRAFTVLADGGLKVSTRLEVLNDDGHPIPGLFAAGSTGQGGLLLRGHGHHLAWAFSSGRLAGRYAAGTSRAGVLPVGAESTCDSIAPDSVVSS